MPVPTNVKDLDSHIVMRFVEIREKQENPSEDHSYDIASIARVTLGLFIEQACDDANVRYDYQVFGMIQEQAAEDYTVGYNSGPQRRRILFKMAADVRDIISTLDPKPEEIDWSAKLTEYLKNNKIDPDIFRQGKNYGNPYGVSKDFYIQPYGDLSGSMVGPGGGGKTLGLHSDPDAFNASDIYAAFLDEFRNEEIVQQRMDDIDAELEEFLNEMANQPPTQMEIEADVRMRERHEAAHAAAWKAHCKKHGR